MTSWKPQNLFRDPDDLVKTVQSILIGETNKNDKSDDGDGLDAVQPKAVKKKFKDRKDKDIDNDGDVDDSDKFLHKRRKAISKSMKEESDIEEAKMPSSMIAKLKKAYEPMRDKKISMNNAKKLTAIMNKFGDDKDMLIQLMKADIPFVSQGAVTKLIIKHGMKGAELNKMMKEDVDLDEAIKDYEVKIKIGSKTNSYTMTAKDELSAAQSVLHSVMARSRTGGSPGLDAVRKQFPDMKSLKKKGISVSIKEEVDLEEGFINLGGAKVKDDEKSILQHIKKTFPNVKKVKKDPQHGWIPVFEDVDLDEGTKQVLAHGGKGQYKAVRDGGITKVMYKGKVVGTADFDRGANGFFASIKGEKGQKSFDDAQAMVDYFAKNKITEEVDLEEKTKGMILVADPKTQKVIKIDEKDWPKYEKKGYVQAESNDLDEARIDDVLAVALDNAANKHSPKGRDWGKLTATAAQKLIDKEMEKLGYAMTAGGKWVKEGVYENDVPCAECGKVHEGACAPEDMKEEILDEGKVKYTRNLMKNKSIVDYVKKQQEKNRKNVVKFGNKKVGAFGNEPRFDSGADWLDMASDEVNLSSMSLDKRKAFDAEAEYEAIARKLGLDKFEPKLKEDIVVEAKTVKEDDEDDSDKTDAQKNDMDGDGEKDSKKKKKKKKGDDEDEESSKPDKIDTEPQIKTMVSEREMTEKEKSKLEHLKKNFEGGEMHKSMKTKYGDKGDDVFYGKLTKMAMGEEVSLNIDEAEDGGNENLMMALRKSVSLRGQHQVAFKDGSKVKISQKDAQNLLNRLQKEKPASREAMMKSAYKSEKHFKMALKGKVEPKKNPLDLD